MDDLSGSSKGLSLLVCTVCSDVPVFIVGPISFVTVHGPVHQDLASHK